MNNKNIVIEFILHHISLIILGSAFILSSLALTLIEKFDVSRLKAFGVVSQIYYTGIKNGLITATLILFISFFSFLFFKKYLHKIKLYLENFYTSFGNTKKIIIVLVICFVFAFVTHSGNIMNGYFDMDDFSVIGVNQTTSLGKSLLITHDDHTIPLFRVEMRVLYSLFGQNPIPYNIFVFIIFSLIPFFTYLLFKRFNLKTSHWLIFLAIYSGSMGWSEMLTGYYIISIFLQVILFFVISIWSYLAWLQTKNWLYIFIFSVSLLSALLIDLSGAWTIPAILLFVIFQTMPDGKLNASFFKHFLIEQKIPLIIIGIITTLFTFFLLITFLVLAPNTFPIKANYPLTSLGLAKNLMTIVSSGMTLSILAPNIAKIIAHPAFEVFLGKFWVMLGIIILFANAIGLWFILKKSNKKEKYLAIFLAITFTLTIGMIVSARPDDSNIPNFDFKHIGIPFYFYCLLLTLGASLFIRLKNGFALKIIIPTILIIISLQQAFNFFSLRLIVEARERKIVVENISSKLIGELKNINRNNPSTPLTIPNLDGQYIYQPLFGYTLADYIPFFNSKIPIKLIRNDLMNPDLKTHTVLRVSDLRGATSKSFIEALKTSSVLRSYYIPKVLMRYSSDTIENYKGSLSIIPGSGATTTLISWPINPQKHHIVSIILSTDNTSGSTEIYFSFENDFKTNYINGQIKIDDYTPYTLANNIRNYNITTDLLQLYAYSLSEKVSDITLQSSTRKNMRIHKIYFK